MSIDLTPVETSRAAIETNLMSSDTDNQKLLNLNGELNTFKKDLSDLLQYIRANLNLLATTSQRQPVLDEMTLIYGTMGSVTEFIHSLFGVDPLSLDSKEKSALITSAMAGDSMASTIETICNNIQINNNITAINNTTSQSTTDINNILATQDYISIRIAFLEKHIH